MGFAPSARTEAQIFGKHALGQTADAKFGVLSTRTTTSARILSSA